LSRAELSRRKQEPLNPALPVGMMAKLTGSPEHEQRRSGYFHTLREILQQPETWLRTGKMMISLAEPLSGVLIGVRTLILTGSGSSQFAGECVNLPLQNDLAIPVQILSGGTLLTHGGRAIVPGRPGLMVSFGRSGDSPESVGAVSHILETEPEIRHLVITCNAQGKLATSYRGDPRVKEVVLDEQTNDRSLVMTSSFTNMILAARFLGMLQVPDEYLALTEGLSTLADGLLREHADELAEMAQRDYDRVLFLGSGTRLGAARESSLKMLEMTAGHVLATCQTYLGLRHGPMSAVNARTLVVCLLSSDTLVRSYECDLIRELNDKQLGMAKIIFGEEVPGDLAREGDLVIDCHGISTLGDDNMPVVDAILGQLLAFFRCLKEGLYPDSPSKDGVIHRVVQEFTLHHVDR